MTVPILVVTIRQAALSSVSGPDTWGGCICWSNLLIGQLFWRELFGMLTFPPLPEGHDDLLEHAGHRDSEQPTEQTEEFCAGEECEESYNGMNPDCSAENARGQYLPQDNPHEQHDKNSHGQHHHPSLWESRQDAQRRYDKGPDHRDKVEQKEERPQQSRVWDAQQRQHNAGTQGSGEREQRRAPEVPTQAGVERAQQEVDGIPLIGRSFVAEPGDHAGTIQKKVDAERDNDDEIDDVVEQPGQERKQP